MSNTSQPFLTARWEHLVFANFRCPPEILQPHVPQGTQLDPYDGQHFVSLVGFMFRNTLVRGLAVPCHRTFEEVNLRFYVRRTTESGEVRRAVVFLRELVPRRVIATIARLFYNEPYLAVPMSHAIEFESAQSGTVSYGWGYQGERYNLCATVTGSLALPLAGSQAEFITEHYWGYTRQRDGSTLEYQVEHPTWQQWRANAAKIDGPMYLLYGREFGEVLRREPASVFVADGSAVAVHRGKRLTVA